MKPKTMILMGLAIVCGLGASYMTSRLLAQRQQTDAVVERVDILIARRPLSIYEPVNKPEEMFEIIQIDKQHDAPDLLRNFDQVRGKRLRQSRNRGDRITAPNITTDGGLDIPEGHQGVGLPVTLQTTAHGLATLPGSYVDLTFISRGADHRTTFAQTVMEKVLVLAADVRISPEGEIVAPAQIVTFALKEEDKLALSALNTQGVITLSLRRRGDNTVTNKSLRMTAFSALSRNEPVQPEKKVEIVVAPPVKVETTKAPEYMLHIINGNQVQAVSESGEITESTLPGSGATRGPRKDAAKEF